TEEYDVWLVALDRLKERQEAEARAAATETAEARAAAWERLFRGPMSSQRLREEWAHGLARNPAVSEDLRAGLLGLTPHLLWRALPASVVEAAMVHPEWQVRALLAEVQPNITTEQWARLILGEQDARRRWVLTLLAADRRAELTGTAYARLASDPSAQTRHEAARLTGLPAHLLAVLARDVDPSVRASACRGTAWSQLDSTIRLALLDDPDGKVRVEARLRHHQEHPLSRSAYDSEGLGRSDASRTCRLERDLAEHLAHHGDPGRRSDLAGNPWLDSDLVALLALDPDEGVRFAVSTRPDLTEEQRAGIAVDFDPSTRSSALDWVRALHDDPDAMRRLAASSHPLVRRSVARAGHLPPDVVESLARDEDRACSSSSPNRATTRPPRCCCGCGSGGTAVSAHPTVPTAIRTSPAVTWSVMPTTRTQGCGNWPWTTRSRPWSSSSASAGTATRRSGCGPRPTPGWRRRRRCGCSTTPTSRCGGRRPGTRDCRRGP
ncbi:hypothetical protein ACFQ9H_26015, partial [Streptomyces sp. NPDC056517]